ncbi:MAG: enoyl-CoA hydratase/isomerase family protein [Alphaproteobacteria bacterium]|nr:enoyl-CoA hydratase/isomerase family protein [Alphaproteobacteria bacterium]MBU1514321.1 enoyl-CoA hydratase/isomerase family protein [Alphaproteobacteria bacterium]MBU2095965.1 enoyl-CoA hydratase/isomerase family protein [Alphaproteobacteria bacterium]MBU2153063.1 enoyl-CoA hydratase/isomerase family protein [Alphaproteobacteria bacterium]MBU2363329.1 enoyl-CoA hydratase/isomerase family protein [Alphaproteobacteria bacterium]
MTTAGNLTADLTDLGGAGVAVTDIGVDPPPLRATPGVVQVGVHRGGPVPGGALDPFDILLSCDPAAPGPWVGVPPARLDGVIADLRAAVTAQPVAAAVAAQVLRTSLDVSFDQALVAESLAYSMLLASEGFRTWRAANPARDRPLDTTPRVLIDAGKTLDLRLNRPDARNAFDARMRDELTEALTFALEHPDAPLVSLIGVGPAFSAGGDLDEFGRAADPGQAHLIRTLRSPARLAQALGERLTVTLHGACVGAGIEVPAAAGRVTARPGAHFRLPEVSMGLIPGAGGTASIPRRIGRRRACYMALSGADIDLATALAWRLVDGVEV